jgi:hypothetical protein
MENDVLPTAARLPQRRAFATCKQMPDVHLQRARCQQVALQLVTTTLCLAATHVVEPQVLAVPCCNKPVALPFQAT